MSERPAILRRVSLLCLALVLAALVMPAAASADPAPGGPLVGGRTGGIVLVRAGPRTAFADPHTAPRSAYPVFTPRGPACDPSIGYCAYRVLKNAHPGQPGPAPSGGGI